MSEMWLSGVYCGALGVEFLCVVGVFFIRAQPDDGQHDAPKYVVVASPIASYIIKLVVVLTVIHLFTFQLYVNN
jgi:hypothetical protein